MIRDRLKKLALDALSRLEQEQDAAGLRLYTAPWLVGGSDAPLRDGAVVFDRQGQILAWGSQQEILPRFGWAQRVELGGVLLPGLINAHVRLELGKGNNLPKGLGLTRKLGALREMRRADEQLDPASREAKIRAAVRQAVDSGTAAVGDSTDSLRAVPVLGREGLYGIVFHEIWGFSPRRAAKALAAAAVERARIVPWPDGIRYRLAPHSVYSTAESVIKEVFGRALDLGTTTAIRLAEGDEELDLLKEGGQTARALVEAASSWWDEFQAPGTDPLSYLETLGGLNERVMLVHMNTATRTMVRKAGQAGSPTVLCPRSALHDSGRLPPLPTFLEEGCRLALGTDMASNSPDFSILREAAELHAAFPEVPAQVLIRAATEGGADALGLPTMGAFDLGTSPGLLHADTGDRVPNDPCGWLLRTGSPDLSWLVRPAPPSQAA